MQFKKHCYQAALKSTDQVTFDQANQKCKQLNATMLVVHDDDVMQFVSHYILQKNPKLNYNLWLGLRKPGNYKYGAFQWVDETCFDYNAWGCGEPNNAGSSGENCASVAIGNDHPYSGSWNDDSCGNQMVYMCQKPVDPGESCSFREHLCLLV